MEEKDYLMTPREVAKYMKVSLMTITRRMKDMEDPIPTIKISDRIIRIRFSELQKWMFGFESKS